MELEDFAPVFVLLLAVAIIFGTFEMFANGEAFGFDWFVNMLWFVVGFVVLIILGHWFLAFAIKGEKKMLAS